MLQSALAVFRARAVSGLVPAGGGEGEEGRMKKTKSGKRKRGGGTGDVEAAMADQLDEGHRLARRVR